MNAKSSEVAELQRHPNVHDLRESIIDFEDTAGYLSQMDLVITVDTAVAHLPEPWANRPGRCCPMRPIGAGDASFRQPVVSFHAVIPPAECGGLESCAGGNQPQPQPQRPAFHAPTRRPIAAGRRVLVSSA